MVLRVECLLYSGQNMPEATEKVHTRYGMKLKTKGRCV